MKQRTLEQLGKRERQVVELLYSMKTGSVDDVIKAIENPPSYSAVRTTLNILVRKRFLQQSKSGRKYLYSPTVAPETASRNAIRSMVQTYFNNSIEQAVSGLISADEGKLSDGDYARLIALIRKAKNQRNAR
jgi:BlaI family transcriptional regulator, penicillinase repressor